MKGVHGSDSAPFEWADITTSDVAFRARGKNLSELFANAGLALEEVMTDTSKVKEKVSRTVELEAIDLKQLMFKWLTELIYYRDAEGLVFSKFDVSVDKDGLAMSAVVSGEELDKNVHEIRTQVKACTYHKMKIQKNAEWGAQVILDI